MIIDPKIHGLDPMYFDRRRSVEGALKWSGVSGEPRLVVDIGANVGQSLESFLSWWSSAYCISIEPNPEVFHELEVVAKKIGERAQAINIGVGSYTSKLTLQVSKVDSKTASLHKFNKNAETVNVHRGLGGNKNPWELGDEDDKFITVEVISLDNLIDSKLSADANEMLSRTGIDVMKIDTESWELEILRGATSALQKTKVIILEYRFDDIYGQPPPLHELDKSLSDAGFRFWDISHIYKDLKSMRTIWVDLIYARPLA